ncbi:hypothetical protein Tco_0154354 [Tanacetum coccineum]
MPPRKAPRTRTTPATATTTTTATTLMTDAAIRALISQGVADALAEHEIQRNNNLNGDRSRGSGCGITRLVRTTRECTYTDFLKFQPMNFKGTEGVVGLTQWFERIDIVFNISNCVVKNQVKFATCTLRGVALTWRKSHVKIVGQDAAYGERALMCGRMFPEESDKIEKYVGGLPDMIHVSVMASKPKTMQDAVEFANELMDKKIRTFAERQVENKRKFEDTSRNNQNQQQQNKRQNTSRAYTAGSGTNLDTNIVTGTFLLNNRYGYILFDTGVDRCSVSTAFSSQIDITPTALDHYYDVELADGKKVGSFDVIIGMNWLAKYHAVIVCAEKIVRIPWENETLIVHGDESNWGNETRLNIISCTKTQKYMLKGCHIFLPHVTTKETKDKSEENTGTLSIGPVRNERIVRPTKGAIRQRLYKAQFLTLGSSGLVCQEEGWIISNVHRLPRTEQANSEESLSTPKDWQFI